MKPLVLILSLVALLLQIHIQPGQGWTFQIVNNCSYTIWPATSSPSSSNFNLQKGDSQLVDLPGKESIRVWGRTGCEDGSTSKMVCQTGGCGSDQTNCSGLAVNATLVEFNLRNFDQQDFYDVSLVLGYNLPVMVEPHAPGCNATGCIFDVDGACPKELRLGDACGNPCTVFRTDWYCCVSTYSTPSSCKPTNYSRLFKKACPRAYSYAFDDESSTFSCKGSPYYTITFCPSPQTMASAFSEALQLSPLPSRAPTTLPSPTLSSPAKTSFTSRRAGNSKERKKNVLHISLLVVIPTTISIIFLSGIWICVRKRKSMKRYNAEINDIKAVESLQFELNTIRTATHNFSEENKLGEGGFGEVYKGKLESGQEVAIKRLSQTSGQGDLEFKTEVVVVAKLQHKNLVKLLGFCVASKEKLLVYEYLPNSSLDKFLFDQTKKAALDWKTRLKIIVGLARGLLYLHEDSRLKVIHRDLKPSNILLDEDMNPKISDFGLAKLFEVDQTQGDTNRIVGTYGYMAPEYAITGHYSVKSDVYSFGVIVLEIVSGQKNKFFGRVQIEEALLHRAWRLWNERKPLDLVDTALDCNFPTEEAMKCIHIGLLCIQQDAIQRPKMTSIVAAFSGQSINLPMPKPPHFFGTTNADTEPNECPFPDMHTGPKTITDLYPRE